MIKGELYNPSHEIPNLPVSNWKPLLASHYKKSSNIYTDQENNLLKKVKERNEETRNDEFLKLYFCSKLFQGYNSFFDTSFYSPTPYISQRDEIVMNYLQGVELDRLLVSETTSNENLEKILFQLGQLLTLKSNEGLCHGDFDLRHILVSEGLSQIDLEKLETGNFEQANFENEVLTSRLEKYLEKPLEEHWSFYNGINSIPEEFLSKKCLKETVKNYGTNAKRAIIGNRGRI